MLLRWCGIMGTGILLDEILEKMTHQEALYLQNSPRYSHFKLKFQKIWFWEKHILCIWKCRLREVDFSEFLQLFKRLLLREFWRWKAVRGFILPEMSWKLQIWNKKYNTTRKLFIAHRQGHVNTFGQGFSWWKSTQVWKLSILAFFRWNWCNS